MELCEPDENVLEHRINIYQQDCAETTLLDNEDYMFDIQTLIV